MLVDSHCHLTFHPLYSNLNEILTECKKKKVEKLLTIGTNIENSFLSVEISNKFKIIYCTVGIHPLEAVKQFNLFKNIEKLFNSNNSKIIGIGETGLDYYHEGFNKIKQKILFQKHIELARKKKIPVVVHTRKAEDDTIELIKNEKLLYSTMFLIHCFTGNKNFLKKVLDLDCYVSFSGILTFKKNSFLRDVVKYVPNDKLLIETDSPFLAPDPYRGKINYPYNVGLIAKKIADVLDVDLNYVENFTTLNFKKLFNI